MVDYSINAVPRRVVYTGSAGVGPYAFTFEVLVQTDVAVYKNSTKLTLTTDYTVTINANGTGSVTLVVAATSNDRIIITGARAIKRTTDFATAGDLVAASLNEQLDSNVIFSQQVAETAKRALTAPVYDPEHVDNGGTLDMTLPAAASRASRLLGFGATGNPTVTTNTLTQIDAATTAINTIAASAAGSADAVSFLHGGTGSTATTSGAKLREIVSVKDFGAVGNGVADDSAAINAAILAVNTAGGGRLLFPSGTYMINAQIVLKSNVTLYGADNTVVLKTAAGRTDDMVAGTSLNNVRIEGIIFDGNDLNAATATGIGTGGTNTITVTSVTGTIQAGMRLYGTGIALNAYVRSYNSVTGQVVIESISHADLNNTGTVSGTITFNKTSTSLLNMTSCSHVSIERCTLRKFTVIALALNNPNHALVKRNRIFRTTSSKHSTTQAINIDDSAGRGAYVWVEDNYCGNAGIISICNFAHFTNNDITGWQYGAGIAIGYSDDGGASLYCSVIGNSMSSGSGTDSDGLDLKGIESRGSYTRIQGNLCFANSGAGIWHAGIVSTITGNVCFNNNTNNSAVTGGINLAYQNATYNASGCTVTGNVCWDTNGGSGTQLYGIVMDYRLTSLYVVGNQLEQNKTGTHFIDNGGVAGTTQAISFLGRTYSFSFTFDAPSIANGATTTSVQTVPYAELGDIVTASASISQAGLTLSAFVSVVNTVTVVLTNNSGAAIDLASATFRVYGIKPLY